MLVVFHVALHRFQGVDDGGVVATGELPSDLFHAHSGDVTQDVDGDAACRGDICVPLGAADIGRRNVEGTRNFAYDLLDGDRHRLRLVQDVLDGILCDTDDRLDALEHVVSVQFLDRALQLTDIIFQVIRDKFGNILR